MRSSLRFASSLTVLLLAACADGTMNTADRSAAFGADVTRSRSAVGGYTSCGAAESISAMIEQSLRGGIPGAEVVRIEPAMIARAAEAGVPVALPMVTEEGRLTELEVIPRASNPFSSDAVAATKSDRGAIESRSMASGAIFDLTCADGTTCGVITMLDGETAADATRYEGMVIHDSVGWVFFESASSLLLNANGRMTEVPEACGVVYNANDQYALQPEGSDDDPTDGGGGWDEDPPAPKEDSGPVVAVIPIMLDSDASFYNLDPETWESRQFSTIVATSIIYGIIEPITSNKFQIAFEIASQETWVKNGPTTTDGVKLSDEINDPDYYMINHHGDNELSYFFVGYDMSGGIGGRAGSICNAGADDLGFGTNYAHQRNHAWGQQVTDGDGGYQFSTMFGRTVVAAHEIGHMLGGLHSDGELNACAGGALPNLCGCTLMLSGASGGVAPDFRKPFFSDANDANIADCVDDVY